MKRVLIIDPVCPKAYSPQTLATEAMGGTEATVVRVAEALGQHCRVTVMQHVRNSDVFSGETVRYMSLEQDYFGQRWDAVILLRDPYALPDIRRHYKGPLYLWLHDLAGPTLVHGRHAIEATQPIVVTVSDFHKTQVIDLFKVLFTSETCPRVVRVYNPVDDSLKPNDTPVDRNKLVFFSSPHKGLKETVELFASALNFNPDFKLYVANPGYFFTQNVQITNCTLISTNVVDVGSLPHHEILKHVREALCVFYPNYVFPETFGLVMAEANAVGTPVLTHAHGAAPEVVCSRNQLLDCRNRVAALDRLMAWYGDNRPTVHCKPEFRTTAVIREWRKLLNV